MDYGTETQDTFHRSQLNGECVEGGRAAEVEWGAGEKCADGIYGGSTRNDPRLRQERRSFETAEFG